MRLSSHRPGVWLLAFSFLVPAAGQTNCVSPPPAKPACSFTALNGNCAIQIDRLNPAIRPTIYARRGSKITVSVVNPSPFENLTLDLKSTTSVVPPDQFANGFATIATNAGTIALIAPAAPARAVVGARPAAGSAEDIAKEQKELSDEMNNYLDSDNASGPVALARTPLQMIKVAVQPPPIGVCYQGSPMPQPWGDTADWKKTIATDLAAAIKSVPAGLLDPKNPGGYKFQIDELNKAIHVLSMDSTMASADDIAILRKNQDSLSATLGGLKQYLSRLKALQDEVGTIPDTVQPGSLTIADLQPADHNYQTEVWSLNYTNKLAPLVKRVSADKFTDEDSALLAGLGDAPSKQPMVAITVQYQSSPRFEISSGLLVPFTPYHSYTAAQTQTASAPVVQQTLTYTVIPVADINFLLGHELIARQQRLAFFATAAVGYCPATSSVAFGVGPSFSWRSVVLSPLVNIGRDTQLTGGFTVGGSLGTSSTPATAPLTTNVWTAKPAMGISIRIPLSGASQ